MNIKKLTKTYHPWDVPSSIRDDEWEEDPKFLEWAEREMDKNGYPGEDEVECCCCGEIVPISETTYSLDGQRVCFNCLNLCGFRLSALRGGQG